jgi:hypothetical protein
MEQSSLVERLERIERENTRFRRSTRIMKILLASTIALVATIVSVPKVHSILLPGIVTAREFDLLSPSFHVTAKLQTLRNGPNLTFYDNSGKIVADVGWVNDSTSAQAGLSVFDGNSVLAGNGVARAEVGFTARRSAGTGVGLASYDGTGALRTATGQALNGSIAYEYLYDESGALRTGILLPSSANIGYFNQDADGTPRISLYESQDGLVSSLSLIHQSGIEGADAIANDETGFVGSNFATWNADHSHIASIIGVGEPSDSGFVDTTNASGILSGHLP